MAHGQTPVRRLLLTGAALVALGACDDFDPDLRGIGNGLDTSRAVQDMPGRPRPDDRGVITYPTYQVVVAQQDDTIRGIAIRLGLDANELATFNGIEPDVVLRRDEIIALPGRLPDAGAAPAAAGQPLDVSAVATGALERAGTVTATPLDPATPATASAAPAPATPAGPEPIRHQVQRGETVFALSRLYGVPVRTIAEWNGLDSAFTVRTGQYLLIPRTAAPAPAAQVVEAPGAGSATPVPPSASTPLPNERPSAPLPATATPPAPDLGTPSASSSSAARLVMPVQGSIIRAYAPGTNEGIDIAAPAGTPVKAADAGTVAAVTTNTEGVAIVVIKHNDGLLTVYTFIDELAVNKNDSVSRGQTIAKVASGNPSFLHFEARRGLQSVDPTTLLP